MERNLHWPRGVHARSSGVPLVLAHRGSSVHEIENTLRAFHRAMADGADGVELDVQCCATGEPVVFHDNDLRRMAGIPDRIDRLPLATLRQVRLHAGGEIPTLAEALEVCGPTGLVNIEIKCGGRVPRGCRALVVAVADAVARAGAGERVLVSSFSPAVVWLWRKRSPQVPCGLLFERRKPWPIHMDWLLPWLRPFAVHPEERLCTPETVARWRGQGYAVNVWTVDVPARIETLAAMGVSGLITNDPGRARIALGALGPRP